jgi:5-formyltetrahydrofolate cyclo-ligase
MSTPVFVRADARQRLLARRAAQGEHERQSDAQLLLPVLAALVAELTGRLSERGDVAPPVIGAYWPIRGELDLRPLFATWPCVALPQVVARDAPLAFRRWTGHDAMVAGAFGIAEPTSGELLLPDLILIPCLGYFFDKAGRVYRLGYGGGFYDRTLAVRQVQTVGIAYDWAEAPDCQPAAHDVALDYLLTPHRRI